MDISIISPLKGPLKGPFFTARSGERSGGFAALGRHGLFAREAWLMHVSLSSKVGDADGTCDGNSSQHWERVNTLG